MAIDKANYQERTVIENGKVVTYGIPHGRLHPEIVSMTPLSEEKFFQDKVSEVEEIKAAADEQMQKQKEEAAQQTLETQQAENEQVSKEKAASIKKAGKESK